MANPKVHIKIFKIILKEPLSMYGIYRESGKTIGKSTISKILKIFRSEGLIEPYDVRKEYDLQQSQRWGPTILGISKLCPYDPRLPRELGDIFDRWSKYPEFQKELENIGFDEMMMKNLTHNGRDIFEKLIKYLDGVMRIISKLKEEPDSFDAKTLYTIGEFLFQQNPENKRMFEEIKSALPNFQQNVDVLAKKLKKRYRGFSPRVKKN
jgi:hypothetical protein